jgi:hypothetical protein
MLLNVSERNFGFKSNLVIWLYFKKQKDENAIICQFEFVFTFKSNLVISLCFWNVKRLIYPRLIW